jgi:hypothetical protein
VSLVVNGAEIVDRAILDEEVAGMQPRGRIARLVEAVVHRRLHGRQDPKLVPAGGVGFGNDIPGAPIFDLFGVGATDPDLTSPGAGAGTILIPISWVINF